MTAGIRLKYVARLRVERAAGAHLPHVDLTDVDSGGTGVWRAGNPDRDTEPLLALPGDVVLSKLRPYLRKGFAVTQPVTCSSEFLVITPTAEMEPVYLSKVLLGRAFTDYAMARVEGTKMPRVAWNDVCDFRIADLDDQRRVADFLDGECARLNLAISAAVEMGQAVDEPALALAERQFEQWKHARVGYLFEVQLGKMLDERRIDREATLPYLRNANVQWGEVRLDDLKEMSFSAVERAKFALRRGDLLVCEGGEPGRAAIWDHDDVEMYYQKALHRLRPLADASPVFAMWMLRILSQRGAFRSDGPGRYTHLTAEALRAVRIPAPAADVQATVAEDLQAKAIRARRLRAELRDLADGLASYRDALIAEAVTGQLDVSKMSDARMDENLAAVREGEAPEVLAP